MPLVDGPKRHENVSVVIERLEPYDRTWARQFAAERERLEAAVPDAVAGVQHVGSTAVPGLAAAPIIDILLTLHRPLNETEIAALEALQYTFRGEEGISGRQLFVRTTEPRAIVHAFPDDHMAGKAMINFRNHLLANPEARAEYEAAKRRLEQEFASDPAAFEREKDQLLRQFDRRAALWAHEQWRKRMEAGEVEDHEGDMRER